MCAHIFPPADNKPLSREGGEEGGGELIRGGREKLEGLLADAKIHYESLKSNFS